MHCCDKYFDVSVMLYDSVNISELNNHDKYFKTLNCEKQAAGPCYLKTTQINSDEF